MGRIYLTWALDLADLGSICLSGQCIDSGLRIILWREGQEMSRSGNVRFKSIHYWMLVGLIAAALVFTGCGGTGNGSGNSVSGSDSAVSGSNTADPVGNPAGRKSPLPEIYDPNPDYDKYALVEYSIDDIGAEFTATVSADDDDSEYEVHCNLGRTEQVVILDADYSVIYDRTGRMGSDAALIVQKAVEENDWRKIGE